MSVEETTTETESSRLQVAIVGVGRAGNNLLSHAITGGINPDNCVAVSRSLNQLSESQARNKILLAEARAGSQISQGRPSAVHMFAHRVSPFTRESDVTILLTGLGGATGTTAAPTIAQLNRSQVRPVVSVVSLPFIHERERRLMALRGLKGMVESCDCTVVVDNAVQFHATSSSERGADETMGRAVKCLTETITKGGPQLTRRILDTLSLGQVATVCSSSISPIAGVQSALIDALGIPSANLPVSKAKGAIMVFRGPGKLSTGDAVRAYETLVSFAGHDVDFVHASIASDSDASLLLFLSGYSYGNALGAFVDLIEDLYDLEYGVDCGQLALGIPVGLYQMESF